MKKHSFFSVEQNELRAPSHGVDALKRPEETEHAQSLRHFQKDHISRKRKFPTNHLGFGSDVSLNLQLCSHSY